jgi:hypothetical protein
MCTVNALCLDSLPEFLDHIVELKKLHGRDFPSFTLNILRFPSFQSPLVLSDSLREEYKNNLAKWLANHQGSIYLHEHEINHVLRLIDYLDVVKTPHSGEFDLPKLHNDFKQFYTQYDQRRINKNFNTTFTKKLVDWYNTL